MRSGLALDRVKLELELFMRISAEFLFRWACTFAVLMLSFTVQAQTPCALVCPANVTIGTPPGEATATFAYSTPIATGACNSTTVLQTAGLPPPSAEFPIGTTTNCFSVGNNEASCCFSVQVTATPAPKAVPALGTGSILLLVAMIALVLMRKLSLNRKR